MIIGLSVSESEGWEVVILQDDLLLALGSGLAGVRRLVVPAALLFAGASLLPSGLFLPLPAGLRAADAEPEQLGVGGVEAHLVLQVAAAVLRLLPLALVLLGLQHGQFLLGDPVSLDLALLDGLALLDLRHLDALLAVVLLQSDALGLFGLGLLGLGLLDGLLAVLGVLVLLELVLQVADVAAASSLLAGAVVTAGAAPAVQVVSLGGDLLGRDDLVVPFVPLVVLDVLGEGLVDGGDGTGVFLGLLDLLGLDGLALLVGYMRGVLLFLGGFVWVGVCTKSSSSALSANAAKGFMGLKYL